MTSITDPVWLGFSLFDLGFVLGVMLLVGLAFLAGYFHGLGERRRRHVDELRDEHLAAELERRRIYLQGWHASAAARSGWDARNVHTRRAGRTADGADCVIRVVSREVHEGPILPMWEEMGS